MSQLQIKVARAYFPRGLFQPKASFRFSMDALLLAAYATKLCPSWRRMADLGCGCGPVALGALVLAGDESGREALGLDLQPELLDAAGKNAALLGFDKVFRAEQADFASYEQGKRGGSFDLVTANPPYRLPGEGRLPPSALRRTALFGDGDNLAAFVRAGGRLLAPDGLFCLIFPAGRFDELVACLAQEGLGLCTAMPVLAKAGGEPLLVLGAARKNLINNGLSWREQEPLVLYDALPEGGKRISDAALDFCPFLSCNAETAGEVKIAERNL